MVLKLFGIGIDIDNIIKGHSNSNLNLVLQDFQKISKQILEL